MAVTYSVRRAIVTGAAQGIGKAIAARLAAEGLSVALLDLDARGAEAAAHEVAEQTDGTAIGLACDVSQSAQVDRAVAQAAEALGGLDTVVTNAGITRDTFLHKMTDEQWRAVLDVHLSGTFYCLRAAAPHLRAEGPGRVVCIGSISGAQGNLGQANYSAAKGGIGALVKTAAREFARAGTTVNAVRPGFIDTAMTQALPPPAREAILTATPIGRPGTPEDIAGTVAFLCSDDAGFLTGALLDVNGGAYM